MTEMHMIFNTAHEQFAKRLPMNAEIDRTLVVPAIRHQRTHRFEPCIDESRSRCRKRCRTAKHLVHRQRPRTGQCALPGRIDPDAISLRTFVQRVVALVDIEANTPAFQRLGEAKTTEAGADNGDVEARVHDRTSLNGTSR